MINEGARTSNFNLFYVQENDFSALKSANVQYKNLSGEPKTYFGALIQEEIDLMEADFPYYFAPSI